MENFTVVYKTQSLQFCSVLNGELVVIHCPTFFEVHSAPFFMRNAMLSTYKGFFRLNNQAIQSPYTYSKMGEGGSFASFIYSKNSSFQLLKYAEMSVPGGSAT